ncbi:P-type DNA transfer ATPase VirB11 [Neorhizobium sp. T786]|uniref:P-type DNA transfer ATPase VirB11 n=1 Tax=Pseudorhizobium xiangyangii TaxID=2883104 RepID=UPI001CFFBB70|nr:P-type DNA transfer ATPase VirB11 [Neorhizobium xiangyangii]MCB5205171.1 P-type DNA transfer ATPase VirB11 [Neorhizobium xiangyangii]
MSVMVSSLSHFLGPIVGWLAQEDTTEIVINKPGEVWVEGAKGWTVHLEPTMTAEFLMGFALVAGRETKQDISATNPVLSCTLPHGERCQIVIPPAVPQETISITIRKPSTLTYDLEDFRRIGLFDDIIVEDEKLSDNDRQLLELHRSRQWEGFFDLAVKSHKNIIISGATGSGKTTFSKGLIRCIPNHERIITIEDTAELEIPQPNHVRLMYSKDGQGLSSAGPKQLLESCLRMRPDRILLQELRDGTAFFYLRNVNSGHPGSITTVHANSASLAFEQLSLLIKESEGGSDLGRDDIRALLHLLVDVVVQIKKQSDGRRRITEVYFDPEGKARHGL